MTNNEAQILEVAAEAFRGTAGVPIRTLREQPIGADALVEIETDRGPARFAAEIKAVDRFETPAQVKAMTGRLPAPPLLVAPYLTRQTAEHCKNLDLPFIDMAGNAYIHVPGLFVYMVGNPRPKTFARYRALGPAGVRIVFALLCRPYLAEANYRAVAKAAGVALGTVGPALEDLERRGLLGKAITGGRRIVDPERLLREWVTHYPTTLRPKLNPRQFEGDPDVLMRAELPENTYWGGEAAADKLTHMLKPEAFTIYTQTPIAKMVAANRLRARPGGNVEIVDVFWDEADVHGAPGIVPFPLVYADLLATQDGRNIEAAKLIYERFLQPTLHTVG